MMLLLELSAAEFGPEKLSSSKKLDPKERRMRSKNRRINACVFI